MRKGVCVSHRFRRDYVVDGEVSGWYRSKTECAHVGGVSGCCGFKTGESACKQIEVDWIQKWHAADYSFAEVAHPDIHTVHTDTHTHTTTHLQKWHLQSLLWTNTHDRIGSCRRCRYR